MDLHLRDKVAVITGGSKGIGYATAEAFLREGARVALCARRESTLNEAKEALGHLSEVFTFACDITQEDALYRFAEATHAHYGAIDCWVNNVGAPGPKTGNEYTASDIQRLNELTFQSVVFGCQAAFRYMRETGGSIVNISSLAARCPTVGRSTLYGPLKAAIVQATHTFAAEYAAYGVRVVCVMPGFTATPAVRETISRDELARNAEGTLFRRVATPEEIAAPIVFLASGAASYITASTLDITNGRNLFLNPNYSYEQKALETN